MTFDVTWSG